MGTGSIEDDADYPAGSCWDYGGEMFGWQMLIARYDRRWVFPMRSLKAVVIGVLFIIIVTLVLQLVFLLAAVGYGDLAKEYAFLDQIKGYFRYLIGMPLALLIMFFGGYITAEIAQSNALVHSAITALVCLALAIVPTLEIFALTLQGVVTLAVAFLVTVAGGWYQTRSPD